MQPQPPYDQQPESQWTPVYPAGQQYAPPPGQGYQPGQATPPLPVAAPPYGAPQPGYAPPPLQQQDAPGYPPPGQMPPQQQPPQQPQQQPPPGTDNNTPYTVPPTGFKRVRPKQKNSKGGMIAMMLIVVAFGVIAALRSISPGQSAYGYVRSDSLSAVYTGDALVVRDETVFTQEGVSQIEYVAEEGAEVKRTASICLVYTAGFNPKELTTLRNYRTQIKEYHKTLLSAQTQDVALKRLEQNVVDRALEAQRLVHGARGSLINQEVLLTSAMQERQLYLKQKYPDDQKLARLYDDENSQMQRISSWTKQFSASVDGLVSFYTDGYEVSLNMKTYQDFTPAQVRNMIGGDIPADPNATRNTVSIFRIVRKNTWSVLMLCDDREWKPVQGQTYKLRIESFDNIVVNATVEGFTLSGGELLVRLTIDDTAAVSNVLYIRSCKVELGESVNGLTVPKRAIYNQNGKVGVVLMIEGRPFFTTVTVLEYQGEVAYIIPDNPSVLYEGLTVMLH